MTIAAGQTALAADVLARVSAEKLWGSNLIRNYPSLERADGAQPEWWEVINDPTLTEEDATGEAIPQIYERVLKLIISADGGGADYAYQDFDDADEPTLDDNVTKVSAGCWVYTADVGTVTLELYDVDGAASLGTATTSTTGSWVWLEVLDKTFQDSMRWRVTHSANNATLYIALPSLNVGAAVRPWQRRGLRYIEKEVINHLTEDPGADTWADLDFTAVTSNLTAALLLMVTIGVNASSGQGWGYLRRNGSASTGGPVAGTCDGVHGAGGNIFILTDDGQVIEESVSNSAQVVTWTISMSGYYEWE